MVQLVTVALTVPALVLAFFIGRDFMPRLDEGAFLIQTMLPPEASLAQVDAANHRAEDLLRAFPEVEDVVRRTGRAERTEDPMPHTVSDVLVVLKPERTRSLDELEEAMREKVAKVPGVSALFTTPLGMRIDEGLGGTPADISVRIFGPDLDELEPPGRTGADASWDASGGSPTCGRRSSAACRRSGSPWTARPCARVGLTPGEVVRGGADRPRRRGVRAGLDRPEALRPRPPPPGRPAPRPGRRALPPHRRARRQQGDAGPGGRGSRRRSDPRPCGARPAAGASPSRPASPVATSAAPPRTSSGPIESGLPLPTGYFFDVGGRVESQQRATRALLLAAGAAVVAVFVLLYLALGSTAEVLIILATLPVAFVGGIVALFLAGETWNVSSLVGLIGLFGIAVQNSLVLVTQTRGLLAEGRPFHEALREASIGRVRPKIMTAATAILGLLPLLVLRLHGTEIERPLAVVMVGGLVTSTLFTLLALPTFYMLVHRWQERWRARPGSAGGGGVMTTVGTAVPRGCAVPGLHPETGE